MPAVDMALQLKRTFNFGGLMKKDCTTCLFAEWPRSGGRRHFGNGDCTKEVDIPAAYNDYSGRPPDKRQVSKYIKPGCPCWEKDTRKPITRIPVEA